PAHARLAVGHRAVRIRHPGRAAPSSPGRMSRPPYLSPGVGRRRRRRRRWPMAVLLLLLLVIAGVLVAARSVTRDDPAPGSHATGGAPLQLANGPVSAEPGPRPLAVKLDERDTI